MKAASTLLIFLIASVPALSQDVESGEFIIGGPNTGDSPPAVDQGDGTVVVIPEEAKTHYPLGGAPYHAMLQAYSLYLDFATRIGDEGALREEARILGASIDEMESVASILSGYTVQKNDSWEGELREICLPILRGQSIDNDGARAALAALDDNDERLNEIAEEVVSSSAARLRGELFSRIEERIISYGENVEHTKVHLIEAIEATEGGDFQAHLIRSCESL